MEKYKIIYPFDKWIVDNYDFSINVVKWCNDTFGTDNCECLVTHFTPVFYFKYEKDAALFKLKYL